jgi:4-hydroxy-tetrahydrodipicolinate synthase
MTTAAKTTRIAGIWAAIPTPFDPDGAIDEAGVRRNVRHFADGLGLDGVFCNGLMGEIWALELHERRRLAEIIRDEAGDRLKVSVVTSHHAHGETLALTRHAAAIGCDTAVLLAPAVGPRDEETVFRHLAAVAEAAPIDIVLFHRAGTDQALSPALLARLAVLPNVVAVKSTASPDVNARLREALGGRLVVCDPHEEFLLGHLLAGAEPVLYADPEPYLYQAPGDRPIADYLRAFGEGRIEACVAGFRGLRPLRRVYNRWIMDPLRRGRMPNAALKHWCELLGLAGGPVRPPLVPLAAADKAALAADLAAAQEARRVRS